MTIDTPFGTYRSFDEDAFTAPVAQPVRPFA